MKNVLGQRLTKGFRVDRRSMPGQAPKRANDGRAYMLYQVEHKPGDQRCWHVVGYDNTSGKRQPISRHTSEHKATLVVERLRMAQPDRNYSRKLAHKLGID